MALERLARVKSPENLQAQAEVFADKSVEDFSEDQAQILKYSAELSKIDDLDNLPADLPEELIDLIQRNKGAYISFLREEKKSEILFREENIKTYKQKFQPAVAELKARMRRGNPKDLPEYLGSGSNGSAFRIEADGQTYAAKFSRSVTQANFEIKPLLRAKGIPHTAQLVSYSFEDGVVIMELLPGVTVTDIAPGERPGYSDGHITQLIETVRELDAKGLVIDPKPSNFIYDKEEGFSVLDYHLKNAGARYGLPQEIIDLRLALSARRFEPLEYAAPDYAERAEAQSIERYRVYLPLMTRFLRILKDNYPDILADWQRQHDEDKDDPNVRVGEIIDRRDIPKHPDLEPYLEELSRLGF
jgi:hypothetical protein